jgi:acyl dehydratase
MALPTRQILHQRAVIASLAGTALSAALQGLRKNGTPPAPLPTPGPEIRQTIPPRPASLVRDYIRWTGGDPSSYRGVLPPHLFPQWGFPLAARTLEGIPYPMARVLNGGCRLEINGPLPADEPLEVSARLEDIDDNGRRAVLHQRVVTGTKSAPQAVIGHLYAIVPLGGGKDRNKPKANGNGAPPREIKQPERVPAGATELAYWRIPADAGLAFAMLTGDFNPVHWIRPYARMFGFKSTILHGFATMAKAMEGLNRSLLAGDTRQITTFDVKFTRPLILPARVGLYVDGDRCFVGDATGGPAYLVGTFTRNGASS